MKRLIILAALAASPAQANFLTDSWDALSGHAVDAYTRFLPDEFIGGELVYKGTFDETAEGQDSVHWARGTAQIRVLKGKRYVQLYEDFKSGPLPDGHVYISAATDINNEADFERAVQIELGPLKKGSGASYYEIPHGMVVNSVTIWCKQFSQYIGSADIEN